MRSLEVQDREVSNSITLAINQCKFGSSIGLRWCTEKDILSGKGNRICGNKHCVYEKGPLSSFEVNMNYVENEVPKNALVKINVCPDCAIKVNYKKLKEMAKKRKKKDKKKKKEKKQKRKESREASEEKKGSKSD